MRQRSHAAAILALAALLSAAALALAASAAAAPGIDLSWGNTAIGGLTKGGFFSAQPRGVATWAGSGDVYVTDAANNRIERFDKDGGFIAAWGRDVDKGGGTGYEKCAAPVGAEADHCQAAGSGALVGELSAPGGIAVDEASGDVYVIDTGNRRVAEYSADGTPLRDFGKNVVASGPDNSGSGFEVCVAGVDVCQAGESGEGGGAFGAFGGTAASAAGSGLAVAPAGAPNAGDVLVADAGNRRLQEFSPSGAFVRAFGWDVVESGPDDSAPVNQFEVCYAGADACKAGSAGAGAGQFGSGGPTRVAEGADGRIYTTELAPNFRVQSFALTGNLPAPQGEFAAAALHGSHDGASEAKDDTTEVAVDEAGFLYAVKAFPEGTGTPPAVVEGTFRPSWQQRILKVDPASGEVVATMVVNPGLVAITGNFTATFQWATGLAVVGAGESLYATTAAAPIPLSESYPRVWRLRQIAGLGGSEVRAEEVRASTATLRAMVTPGATPAATSPPLGTRYRFEYSADGVTWKRAPSSEDAKIGNGADGGESSSCSAVAGHRAAVCNVSQAIGGLVPNTTYQLRLVAYTEWDRGQAQTIAGEPFTTNPEPPKVESGAAHWSSPPASGPSLLLSGTVNPGNDRTTYEFEYVDDAAYQADKAAGGSGFGEAALAPPLAATAGNGLETLNVEAVVAGLDPSLAYHYRLVAANSLGSRQGAARVVAPPSAEERYFELVSAGDSGGAGTFDGPGPIADNGDRAVFGALAFDEPRSLGVAPGFTTYIAVRGPGGWAPTHSEPDGQRWKGTGLGTNVAADLGARLWVAGSPGEVERSEGQLLLAGIDGSLTDAQRLAPLARSGAGFYTIEGASSDLSRAFFRFSAGGSGGSSVALVEGEALSTGHGSNLYEASGIGSADPAAIQIVNRADGAGGALIGGACGAEMADGPYANSIDGESAFFYAYPGAPAAGESCLSPPTKRLYERIGGERTIEVSKSQCQRTAPAAPCKGETELDGNDKFNAASADGQVVFFTTSRQLASSDEDTTPDLYEYDAEPPAGQPKLVQVSAGEAVAGKHEVGKEAKVLGVIDSAQDGSRVYFVAAGVLTAGENGAHQAPAASANNLYAYERDAAHPAGRIAFVAKLASGIHSEGDEEEWKSIGRQAAAEPVRGDGSGDGRALLFLSTLRLTGEDTDSAKDLYRYDQGTEALSCLSCHGAAGAEAGAGNRNFEVRVMQRQMQNLPDYAEQARVASTDLSTVVFSTKEKLSPEDENETSDAYAWHEGQVELISAGSGAYGIPETGGPASHPVAVSASGKDIFFPTRAALVGSDKNGAFDLYDARVGGGFPEAASASACGDEGSCRGPSPEAAPVAPASPGSASFSGPGDAKAPTAPRACPKGKRRKGGRCVPKPTRKHGKGQHRRAGARRGGGR